MKKLPTLLAFIASLTFAPFVMTQAVSPGRLQSVGHPKTEIFTLRKSTGDRVIPGTYLFTLSCNGPGGPYTGPNPVSVVLPAPGVSTVSVPAGSVCRIVETPPTPGNWLLPSYTGSGIPLEAGGGWEAKVGPIITSGGAVTVTNRPGSGPASKTVPFDIRKTTTGASQIAGNYIFNLSCHVPPNGTPVVYPPVTVSFPNPGQSTVNVPDGAICIIIEQQPAGNWSPPTYTGTSGSFGVQMGQPWEAKVGPVNANSGGTSAGTVLVANRGEVVGRKYDVSIRKRGTSPLVAGQTASFTLSPNNNGPMPVDHHSGLVVTDTLPGNLTAPITANGGPNWNCNVSAQTVTCHYVGTSPMGPGPLPPITLTAIAAKSGRFEQCASISLNKVGPDVNPGDNRDCLPVVINPPAGAVDLGITKTAQVTGQKIVYTINVSNLSGTTPTGTIQLSDLLSNFPPGTYYDFGSGVSACNTPVVGQPWNCVINLNAQPITIGIGLPPSGGSVTNCATVSLAGDTNAQNNTACVTTVVPPVVTAGTGSLTIIKIAQPQSTQTFHFTAPSPGLSGFTLDDDGNNGNQFSNTKTFTNLPAGSYTVTEDAVNGWTVPSLQCLVAVPGATTTFTDQLHRTFTIGLQAGAHVTCTFINVKTWPSTAAVNIYNPMMPFGPQTVNISVGGTVTFNNVNSGQPWTITYASGPSTFGPVPLATSPSSGTTSPFTTPGSYTYTISGTPSFTLPGHIIVH